MVSWTDDIRCLYCDARLPLYRKITSGQFCNAAHGKAYWQEQERLAVERLEETHHSLCVHRPPLSGIARLRLAKINSSPGIIAADPLAYAMCVETRIESPAAPHFSRAPQVSVADRAALLPARPWQLANRIADFKSIAGPLDPPRYPSSAPVLQMCRVGAADWLPMPLGNRIVHGTRARMRAGRLTPVACAPLPLNPLSLAIPPRSEELQRLVDEQIPRPDQLLALPRCAIQGKSARSGPVRHSVLQPVSIAIAPWAQLQFDQGLLRAELADTSLLPVALDRSPSLPGTRIAPLDALDQHMDSPRFAPATPSRCPRLAPASGIRYPVARPESVPSMAKIEPAVMVLELPYIALPRRKVMVARAAVASRNFESVPNPARLLPLACTAKPVPSPIHIVARRTAFTAAPLVGAEPARPASQLEPLDRKPVTDFIPPPPVWVQALGSWENAPRSLKTLFFAIPVLLALVLDPPSPKLMAAVNREWAVVRQTVLDRAAVVLHEDFRAGLNRWVSRGEAAAAWSFDSNGFVRPGPLAIYRPSLGLTDYQMQFLGLIDKKALSWVVRAADFDNYYVVKLVVRKPGPLTTLGVTRYAVVNGRASARVENVAPVDARADTLYRVRLDVHGDTYVLAVQGQIVDTWSESRLKRGGVGFFSARGEESRMRWLELTHQYDTLGRLCAYLAPYGISSNKGGLER